MNLKLNDFRPNLFFLHAAALVLLVGCGDAPQPAVLTCNWSFTSKPAGSFASIIGAGKEQTEFTLPVNGSYKVTLWDGAFKTALVTRTIEITNRDLRFTYLSTEIELEKGKVYMITVNADNWYNHIDEQDSQSNQYPQTIDNFEYISLGFHEGDTQVYPDVFPVNYITKGRGCHFC